MAWSIVYRDSVAAGDPDATTNQKYVRAGATGSGSGDDWTNAYTSFSGISFSADTTYWVAGGSYSGFDIDASGTSGARIRVKRATSTFHGTETGWSAGYDAQVTINGSISLGDTSQVPRNYISIDGTVKYGIKVYNADFCIKNIWAGSHTTLRYLELTCPPAADDQDAIQGRGDNLLVEYCYLHDNDNGVTHGDGIQWYRGNNIIIRYNIFKNSGQLTMLCEIWGVDNYEYVENLQMYYNVFYNRGGDHYNGMSHKWPPNVGYSWQIYNNTIDLECTDNSGYNNVFSSNNGMARIFVRNNAILYSNCSSVGGTHEYNGYNNSSPAGVSGTYGCFNIPTETGRVTASDLGFVSIPADGYSGSLGATHYRLTSGSALRGAGTVVNISSVDFDGNPVANPPSIGAFEYV